MLYDVFISHASEDKDSFVRPLADRLRREHVEVWYDEFSLSLGDRIRSSIDTGLSQSRFGIIVLSHAFFSKQWPQYELDGLAQREMQGRDVVLLPIWHGVDRDDIAAYSPPLAGRRAASSKDGLDAVVAEILKVVRPQGSPLIVARDVLLEWGVEPPVITDSFWLDVVEASNRVDAYGPAIPEESAWSRWSFPLPARSSSPQDRGERLAWAAMQMAWTDAAKERCITIITHPNEVHRFIQDHPGLWETCATWPGLLAEYAPQLTIPGFEGDLLDAIEEAHQKSRSSGSGSGSDGEWSLRHLLLAEKNASGVAAAYFGGGIFGPEVSPYEHADHLFWLLSDASAWLPETVRTVLKRGMAEWAVWPWATVRGDRWPGDGSFFDALVRQSQEPKERFRLTEASTGDLLKRMELSVKTLGLPDAAPRIMERFLAEGFVEEYLKRRERRR